VRLYPEARHGFDAEGLPPERRYAFGVIGYHAESARAAWTEIEHFLRR
jgi:dienelactone hydrolase